MLASRPSFFRVAMVLFVALILPTTTLAQLPPGKDGYTYPPGGNAGTTIPLALAGSDWTPDVQFIVHDPRVKLQLLGPPGEVLMPEAPYWIGIKSYSNDPRLVREASARLVLPADMPLGPVFWSVANANGGTAGGLFLVGNGREVQEDEVRTVPQDVGVLPVTVNGRLRRIEEVDRYRLVASRDGLVTCDLVARRLGSDFLGVLEVRDEAGTLIAEAVDTEGRDPILTFAVSKGKSYLISIRDVDYRGYRCFAYRLTLTPGPRVLTALPAVGRRGETRAVEFVGIGLATGKAERESITRQVAFPNDAGREAFSYRLEPPFGPAVEVPLQLTDHPEHLESASPNPQGQRLPAPVAVTGRISQRGERDIYIVAGKKGELWDLAVETGLHGSPVDATLILLGPDGKQLLAKDETGNGHGLQFPFTLPADGDYRFLIGDLSGKTPTAESCYRLAIRRLLPCFHLRTNGIVNLPLGSKTPLNVSILREGGFKEPVTLTVTGLPPGVTVPKEIVLPPTGDSVAVTLECAKDAPATSALVQIVGTATVGGRSLSQPVLGNLGIDLSPRTRNANLTPHLLVTTTLKPPFKAKVAEADGGRRIPRGSTHLSEILLERSAGFQGEILLDMAGAQQRHRQGIRGPALRVAPGQTRIDYPVFLPEWLETSRTSRIGLIALARIPDPKGTLRYVASPVEGQVTMSIEGALMKLSVAPDELRCVVGQPFTVPLRLARTPQFMEPVTVDLLVPTEIAGLVHAKPIPWPRDPTTMTWTLETRVDPRLVGVRTLTARATGLRNGHRVVSETSFEVEFVSDGRPGH